MVGAGAAGLTAALRAAEHGAAVTLLNAHPRIGLKILMSGGTRCNVTHREVTERDFHGGSHRFVRDVLRAFPEKRVRHWLESLGVALKLEETGKYFPVSDEAKTVLEALVGAVEKAGATIIAGARVVRVEAGEAGPSRFRVGVQRVRDSAAFSSAVRGYGGADWSLPEDQPGEWIEADAVILATGGLSFPRTGSDGVGYALARALGHTIVPPTPALTPLTANDPLCAAAQGVALDVELELWIGAQATTCITRGSFLFTHFGYSGPAALDMSRHWLRTAEHHDRRVVANFIPDQRLDSVLEWLQSSAVNEPRGIVRRLLARALPERIADVLLSEIGIDGATMVGQLRREDRMRLASHLVARPLPITGTLGYEKAEVTAGGVSVEEVDPRTMESRIVAGLYLCGEVLDVEGRLGGFNFQWSWSSGTVAGLAAAAMK